jgi:hypothetical protein
MSMLNLRVVCPPELQSEVLALLDARDGVVAITESPASSHGAVVRADLAREPDFIYRPGWFSLITAPAAPPSRFWGGGALLGGGA